MPLMPHSKGSLGARPKFCARVYLIFMHFLAYSNYLYIFHFILSYYLHILSFTCRAGLRCSISRMPPGPSMAFAACRSTTCEWAEEHQRAGLITELKSENERKINNSRIDQKYKITRFCILANHVFDGSIDQSINQAMKQPSNQATNQSTNQSINCFCQSINNQIYFKIQNH